MEIFLSTKFLVDYFSILKEWTLNSTLYSMSYRKSFAISRGIKSWQSYWFSEQKYCTMDFQHDTYDNFSTIFFELSEQNSSLIDLLIASEKFLYDLKDIFFYLYNYTLTIICYFDGHWIEWKCNILHDYVDSLILPLSKLSIVVRKSFPSDNGFHYPIYGDLQLFFIKPIELCSCKTLYIKVNEASENFFQLRCDEQSW